MNRSPLRSFLYLLTLLALFLQPSTLLAQDSSDPCATPQRAVRTFAEATDANPPNLRRAAACFDFSGFQGTRQEQLNVPLHLHDVLSAQGLRVDLSEIPDQADALKDSLPPYTFTLFPTAFDPPLTLQRINARWVFTNSAVESIETSYQSTFSLGLPQIAASLPPIFQKRVLGVALWKLLSAAVLAALAWLLSLLITILFTRAAQPALKRAKLLWLSDSLEHAKRYVRLSIFGLLLLFTLPQLLLPTGLSLTLIFSARIILTIALVLFVWTVIDDFAEFLTKQASKTDTRLDDQLIPLIRKTLKFLLVVVAVLFILQNLNVDVGSLLAGLGIGGLAFAFAAKDTLANLFGSLMIFTDRPFQIGDAVTIGSVEGSIEEVGFRSTRIRTFYSSLVTIPNSTVANSIVDNLGERNARRFKTTLSLSCNTSPEQIMAFVEAVRASLLAHPSVKKNGFEVHFNDMSDSSHDILVYSFLEVPTWTDELRARQDLLLSFLRIARAMNIEYAYPTQTIYHSEQPTHREVPNRDELRAIVESFGPQGDRSGTPHETLTSTGYFPGTQPAPEDDKKHSS